MIAVIPAVLNFIYIAQTAEIVLRLGRWPLMFMLLVASLAFLYRIGPSGRVKQNGGG